MANIFDKYNYDTDIKLKNFEKYVKRPALSRFLARYEIYKKVLNVKGSIVECGVHYGSGVMSWAKLCSIFEPYAIHKRIFGFDTFEGFPDIDNKDFSDSAINNKSLKKSGFSVESVVFDELNECIKEYDEERILNKWEKIQLIKGDAVKTIPKFVEKNPHLVISLLILDFDLYEPTKIALENFLHRVPKGGIILFDEINNSYWPGETVAMIEKFISLNNYRIQKFNFDPNIAYVVVGE